MSTVVIDSAESLHCVTGNECDGTEPCWEICHPRVIQHTSEYTD